MVNPMLATAPVGWSIVVVRAGTALMQRMLGLLSMLAMGFIVAAGLSAGAAESLSFGRVGGGFARLDYGSLGIGLILGVVLSGIARIGWAELPRRAVGWLVARRSTFQLMGWAAVLCVVVVMY